MGILTPIPALLLCGLVLSVAGPTFAQPKATGVGPSGTSLQVRVGWGGYVNAGRWNPVYVTLADPSPRAVSLELRAPHGGFHGMRSRQTMTIVPQPQTFIAYMPLRHYMADDLSFVVRDPVKRRRLADYPAGAFVSFAGGEQVPQGYSFLGVSGRRATLRPITDLLPAARLAAAHIDPADLPESPVGYDCLDVLVLNAPDLTALSPDQQQAIVKWVRAGGNLLLWPGDDPVPESSPLVDVLPVRIGSSDVIELTPDELKAAGLTSRFAKLASRELSPAAGAEPVTLLGIDRLKGYRHRAGLGRVLVCPIDVAALQLQGADKTWALWRVLLKGMIRRLPADGVTADQTHYGGGVAETAQREATALRQVGDMLGSVPGAGRFGFGYVAGILIAMMVVVGPVDWLLLKKLGRQPWTWATTTGWIALVTLSAVYAGHLFKSGDLHYRTFQLVDQADGVTAARTELAALYSPRTDDYEFETDPETWWQPASPGDEYYGYRRTAQDMTFVQTYRGSAPEPAVVNVWNLRFLEGESAQPGTALVRADLKVETTTANGKPRKRLVGTITNPTDKPLNHVMVRTQSGWAVPVTGPGVAGPVRIDPGQTVSVNASIEPAAPANDRDPNGLPRSRNRYYPYEVATIDKTRLWDQGGDLAMRRTDQIEQWVTERPDLACVYAECEGPEPTITLKGRQPIEAHWKVVRALVTLGQ